MQPIYNLKTALPQLFNFGCEKYVTYNMYSDFTKLQLQCC